MNAYRYFLMFSGIMGFMFSLYMYFFRYEKRNIWSTLFLFTCSIYVFGYSMEMNALSVEQAFFWLKFEHLGIVYVDSFWLFSALKFADRRVRNEKTLKITLLLIATFMLLIVFSNNIHHKFYTSIIVERVGDISITVLGKGIFYWILSIQHFIVNGIGGIIFLKTVIGTSQHHKQFMKLVIPMMIIALGIYIPYVAGLTPRGIDTIAFAYAIVIIIWSYLVLNKDLYAKSPIYRENVFKNSAVSILVVDTKLQIIDENIAAFFNFGTMLGRKIEDLSEKIKEHILIRDYLIPQIKIKNSIYKVSISGYLQHNETELAGYIINFSDITELENQKGKIQELLANEEKIIANISHELRTPLNGIKGLAQLLEISEDENRNREYIKHIIDSCSHLTNLVNSLLADFRVETELERFNLKDTLDKITSIFIKDTREKNIQLFTHIANDVPDVLYASLGDFKQIIINLLGNAIKFTQEGGVLLAISCKEYTNEYVNLEISIEDTGLGISQDNIDRVFDSFYREEGLKKEFEGSGLGLAITKNLVENNNGTIRLESKYKIGSNFIVNMEFKHFGKKRELQYSQNLDYIILSKNKILKKYLEKVFVDLNQSYTIFDKYDEFIDLKSEFDNELLLITENDFFESPENLSNLHNEYQDNLIVLNNNSYEQDCIKLINIIIGNQTDLIKNSIKKEVEKFDMLQVLIVEDNKVNTEVISDLLSSMNIDYTCTKSAEEAINILKNKRFDLIFLDLQLGGMNGLDLGKHVIENYSCILVALTASITKNIMDTAFEIGFDEFIGKPFDFEEIFTVFRKYFPNNQINSTTGNIGNLQKYITMLIESLKEDDREIREFITNKKYIELEKKMHLRKGGALQIKLTKLALILEKIEKSSVDKNINSIKKSYEELISEIKYLEGI